MAASASGSARARDEEVELECECGDISASQEDLLARSSFLGGGGGEEEEPEVLSTPLTQGRQEQKKQQGGQGGEEDEDAITMCTLPFTQSPSPTSSESKMKTKQPRKPRVCTRKVRGARIRRTPSLSPDRRNSSSVVDPLCSAVLMIPTTPAAAPTGDLLALARQRGFFF
ncbi:uncharacterized protein LOC133917162 [Phragmites australis]|uniref:uncharacterized protein LOC133917162 n=1 Tax=Phragmites australis TaxID=29695 RepID=UPI002D76ADCA|nr:uncharacterized protein LOC133917162 [Phragmites australis]